jgi:hypothetical protein
MTIDNIREQLYSLNEVELRDKLDLYQNLSSKSVRDEIMITLIEDELFVRIPYIV